MSKSAFRNWFKAQYTRLPNESKWWKLINEQRSLQKRLNEVEIELASENYVQQAWTDALYGWNARDSK